MPPKIRKEDLKQDKTFKLYSYMQKPLNDFKKRINAILIDNFSSFTLENSLFSEIRRYNTGFNLSLALEFLLNIFNSLDNPIDIKSFIIPEMEKFIEEKNQIEII